MHHQSISLHISDKLWNFSEIFQHTKEIQIPVCGKALPTLIRYITFLGNVSIYISWGCLTVSKQNGASFCDSVKNFTWVTKQAGISGRTSDGGHWSKDGGTEVLHLYALGTFWNCSSEIVFPTNVNQLLLVLQNEKLKLMKNIMAWSQSSKFAVRYLFCSSLALTRPWQRLISQCHF